MFSKLSNEKLLVNYHEDTTDSFVVFIFHVCNTKNLYTQWRFMGVGGGGATLNIILLVIGIKDCHIQYNKMKHKFYYYYYYIINNYMYY